MRRAAALVVAVLGAGAVAALVACGGQPSFRLTSSDNDPVRLAAAFRRAEAAPKGPINATGKPLAFLVASGAPRQLIAFDLVARRPLWRVSTAVTSKVAVGGRFVAHLEGEATLVGRDVATGEALWRRRIRGTRFIGAAADRQRLYYTAEDRAGRSSWALHGLDGATGAELWSAAAPGALGAPTARGGLVFSPFLKQWLAILDGRTGEQLTRIRGIDEEITFVRATPEAMFFGSSGGVFRLDERAASGRRAQSTYGKVTLPAALGRAAYGWDAFDPVQAGYSAYDRNRLLWRGDAAGARFGFAGDRVVVASYRTFFGFAASTGALAWAYLFPRVDVVGSAHLGPSIVFASLLGELGALDPASGRRIYRAEVDGQLIGATFDADGFRPSDALGDAGTTAAALAAIARDRDARFTAVKEYAIATLSTLEAAGSAGDLVALVLDERAAPGLRDSAVDSLVRRRDPRGLADLVAALAVPYDHLTGQRPRAVGALARAVTALGGLELDAGARGQVVAALLDKLASPELPADDLTEVVRALAAVGDGAELAPLGGFLLLHRADPSFGEQPGALAAAIDALLARGAARQRELVAFVAEDRRSGAEIAAHAARALLPTTTHTSAQVPAR